MKLNELFEQQKRIIRLVSLSVKLDDPLIVTSIDDQVDDLRPLPLWMVRVTDLLTTISKDEPVTIHYYFAFSATKSNVLLGVKRMFRRLSRQPGIMIYSPPGASTPPTVTLQTIVRQFKMNKDYGNIVTKNYENK